MSNIILCGFKSCGKTTLGKKLAERLGRHFIDTDSLISSNCRAFYLQEGEEAFRAMEKQVIAALVEFQNCVIATGGGTILDQENIAILKKLGTIFYLRVEKEELRRRITDDPPAFLQDESFDEMYESRKLVYEEIADGIITPENIHSWDMNTDSRVLGML